jgi:TetR/AcrR family transcriptional repressor of nem operon
MFGQQNFCNMRSNKCAPDVPAPAKNGQGTGIMGRTREFDRDDVLDRAGEMFWRLGYDVATVEDLESATGLGRGSLYNAFGDKQALFLAALDRYVATYGAAPFKHLRGRDVGRGIRLMLDAILARMNDPAKPRGCLLTNSSLAAGTGSKRIDAEVSRKIGAMEAALETAIARARDDGQIPADAEPRQLARFYCAVIQSLGVTHKALGEAAALHDIVTVAMRSWPGRHRKSAPARIPRPVPRSRRRGRTAAPSRPVR